MVWTIDIFYVPDPTNPKSTVISPTDTIVSSLLNINSKPKFEGDLAGILYIYSN